MARLFFALWPDDTTRTQLDEVAQQFKHEKLRLVKKSNLHMTLEFLGEVDDDINEKLCVSIDQLPPLPSFNLQLSRVGWWQRPQVLWIGTTQTPPALLTLVKSIRQCVKQQELKPDQREYRPHVTIARKADQLIIPNQDFLIDWPVYDFVLVVSTPSETGVVYRVLKCWPLSGK